MIRSSNPCMPHPSPQARGTPPEGVRDSRAAHSHFRQRGTLSRTYRILVTSCGQKRRHFSIFGLNMTQGNCTSFNKNQITLYTIDLMVMTALTILLLTFLSLKILPKQIKFQNSVSASSNLNLPSHVTALSQIPPTNVQRIESAGVSQGRASIDLTLVYVDLSIRLFLIFYNEGLNGKRTHDHCSSESLPRTNCHSLLSHIGCCQRLG
jgi:hypothetical protein